MVRGRIQGFVIAGALTAPVGILLVPQPAAAIDGPSMLTRLAGDVSVIRDGRIVPVRGPVEVAEGSVVRTAANGRALIRYADGSQVLLSESTVLRVETLERRGVSRHISSRLDVGRSLHRVAKGAGAAGGYEVRTAHAVAAVRGTTFSVECTSTTCEVDVEEGVVEVTSATRAAPTITAVLRAGDGVRSTARGLRPRPAASPSPAASRTSRARTTAQNVGERGTQRPRDVPASPLAATATEDAPGHSSDAGEPAPHAQAAGREPAKQPSATGPARSRPPEAPAAGTPRPKATGQPAAAQSPRPQPQPSAPGPRPPSTAAPQRPADPQPTRGRDDQAIGGRG